MTTQILAFSLCVAVLHGAEPAAVDVAPKFRNAPASERRLGADDWWRIFGDAQLSEMLDRVANGNLDVRAASARVEQARATAGIARAGFFPTITLAPSVLRARTSATQRFPGFPGEIPTATLSTITVPLDFGYELDMWGRVRGSVDAANAEVGAAFAMRDALALTLRAEIAATWFTLRTLDEQRAILRDTVALRKESLRLANERMSAGIGTDFDVARAEAEAAAAEAELAALAQRRPALESALAVLTGANPSRFRLPSELAWKGEPRIPMVPAGIPAQLITHRPDVAAAERVLSAAAARVGVAKAAFLPTVRLGGQIGVLTSDVGQTFDKDSRTWSFGVSLSFPLFDGGRNRAGLDSTKAEAKAARAKFEQAVIAATADVETALGALRALSKRNEAQQRVVAATERGASLARSRYKSGTSPYLDVLEAERSALAAQLGFAALNGERLAVTVQLIKALGGGWSGKD